VLREIVAKQRDGPQDGEDQDGGEEDFGAVEERECWRGGRGRFSVSVFLKNIFVFGSGKKGRSWGTHRCSLEK
jgi:hypothetical protein